MRRVRSCFLSLGIIAPDMNSFEKGLLLDGIGDEKLEREVIYENSLRGL